MLTKYPFLVEVERAQFFRARTELELPSRARAEPELRNFYQRAEPSLLKKAHIEIFNHYIYVFLIIQLKSNQNNPFNMLLLS